jgi:hypothetical protein
MNSGAAAASCARMMSAARPERRLRLYVPLRPTRSPGPMEAPTLSDQSCTELLNCPFALHAAPPFATVWYQ